jgi:uncharacterized protein (TIGR00255 family)
MLQSMTGFGRGEAQVGDYTASVELKSVNHRYFEFSVKTPRGCSFLEDKLKTLVQGNASRGKIDCYVTLDSKSENDVVVSLLPAVFKGYWDLFNELQRTHGIPNDLTATSMLQSNVFFKTNKAPFDEEIIWTVVRAAAEEALVRFAEMRTIEGAKLSADIAANANEILEHVAFVEERSPQTVLDYNQKLVARMRELLEGASVDEQRLLQEAAIFADKVAVAEETVRLRSHIAQLFTFLQAEEPIGRKLDFLIQEINREANTIGSKSQEIDVARRVVEIKALVEKIREQAQNIL